MKTATLTNTVTGATTPVHTTYEHPDCHYGQAVWVDDDNVAYMQVGMEHLNPAYRLADIQVVIDIKALMRKYHVTGKTVASRMGILPSSLSNYISRGSNIGVDKLQRIADAIGCDIREFF